MPSKDNVVDEGKEFDFDLEFDHLFYSAGLDDYIDEADYHSIFAQVGDQNLWKDHSTNGYQISFCGGITRACNEGKTEIKELRQKL